MTKLIQLSLGAIYLIAKGQLVYISNEEMLKPEKTIVSGLPKLQPNPRNQQIVNSPAIESLQSGNLNSDDLVKQIVEQILPLFSEPEPEQSTKVEKALDIAGDVADLLG